MKAKAPKKSSKSPKPVRQSSPPQAHRLLKLIVQALDAKKAENLRVLEVRELSSITDYLVLVSGNSEPHLRALRIELEKVLDEEKAKILGIDTSKGSGWIVVDAFEVMIHLFTTENREKYRLESLWKDALELPISKFLK